ncbi:MAG: ATP-binding protein [Phormidesmis sp.]
MPSLVDRVVIPVSGMVPPEMPIKDAIAQMHETQDSCILIVRQRRPVGTFAERDWVRSTTLARSWLREPISTVMIPTVVTIFATEIKDAFLIFQKMQQQHLYHLPVVDDTGNVIGTITQHSLKKAFCPSDIHQRRIKNDFFGRGIAEETTPYAAMQSGAMKKESFIKETAEQLLAEQVKGEFIAMVSHELRTPLTSIHGSIKLLSQGFVSSESTQGQYLLQVAAENSERLVRIVNDILELERLESGTKILRQRLTNTQELTSQAVELSKPLAQKKGIKIELIDEGVQLMADSDRLQQVFTHLLDNAIRFSSAGSTIKITVALTTSDGEDYPLGDSAKNGSSGDSASGDSASGDSASGDSASGDSEATVLFTVCDQGTGIASEQQHRVFERFVQCDNIYITADAQADKTYARGTGLGLAICQNIVEQHSGKIWVESQMGTGSCFHFTLPTRCKQEMQTKK